MLAVNLPTPPMDTSKQPVLLVASSLQPPGGGRALAAWAVNALVGHFDLTVVTTEEIDFDIINNAYGLNLQANQFRHIYLPSPAWIDRLPFGLSQLRLHIMMRRVRRLNLADHTIVSVDNETYFGRRSIQYIHFPWKLWQRPTDELRWYHWSAARHIYYAVLSGISGFTKKRTAENLCLCNSGYIAGLVDNIYHNSPSVLFPPAQGEYTQTPWQARENRFLALGRIAPSKELPTVIAILKKVREAGHNIQLDIVGQSDHCESLEQLQAIMVKEADWVHLHQDISRKKLNAMLTASRYGIHAMWGEHYGMAVAEMVTAGRIVFVHNSGGQVEIVGNQEELCFDNDEQAVENICTVLSNDALQKELLNQLRTMRNKISSEAFCEGLRQHVMEFRRP